MNIRIAKKVMLGLALALAFAVPAAAQEKNIGEVSFQYDYMRIKAKGSTEWETLSKGFNFDAAKRIAWGISLVAGGGMGTGPNIVALGSRDNQTPSKLFYYTGGLRFSPQDANKMIRPFADFVYGGANDNADEMNHFSAMFVGGGIDLKVSKHLAVRVHARMPMLFFFGPVHLGYQAGVGVVIPFNSK